MFILEYILYFVYPFNFFILGLIESQSVDRRVSVASSVFRLDCSVNRLAYQHTYFFLPGLASTLQFIIWSPLRHMLLYERDALGYPPLMLHFPKEAFRGYRQRIAHQVDKGADSALYITLSFATS